ncbi:MAG: SDR family oxidoreductase [Deltaproteobacteria bacterium]|nr:SDR family oxidoreductase [Deltaproteobacteria bacterium]
MVTGAGSGIGREIARAFAVEGATLAVTDINAASAKETVLELPGSGHQAFANDVSSGPSVVETFAAIDAAFGRVDILVNNAGVDHTPGDGREYMLEPGQVIVHMTDEGFTRMMEINVNGVFFCLREAVKLMQREGNAGAIVNMSSIAGLSAHGTLHYAAAKSAVLGITRAAARELGPCGIRVNAICPGVIDTPMTAGVPDAALKPLIGATPLGRTGKPDDIAMAAVYLASDESSFVTGQWLSPNGGLIMC